MLETLEVRALLLRGALDLNLGREATGKACPGDRVCNGAGRPDVVILEHHHIREIHAMRVGAPHEQRVPEPSPIYNGHGMSMVRTRAGPRATSEGRERRARTSGGRTRDEAGEGATREPHFSTMPKPGVVFRVPATRPAQPCSRARLIALCAALATPDARDRMLSAVRSAISKFLVGPLT